MIRPPLKIILVDDNEVFRNTVREILVRLYNIRIIGEASSAIEFWQLKEIETADVILMDVMMPGDDGISVAKRILSHHHDAKIIAVTMHTDKIYLDTLIGAGFVGYIFKGDLFNQINPALATVMHGEMYYPDDVLLSNY